MRAFTKRLSVGILIVGSAGLAGVSAAPPGYESDTRSYNLAHGRIVFTENCLRCHGEGRRGAPMPDEAEDWRLRLAQPLEAMIAHAIEGHGEMPARGDTELTDQEIAAAVAYVVNRARIVVAEQLDSLPAPTAGTARAATNPSPDGAVVQMFLMLMGKDRWK